MLRSSVDCNNQQSHRSGGQLLRLRGPAWSDPTDFIAAHSQFHETIVSSYLWSTFDITQCDAAPVLQSMLMRSPTNSCGSIKYYLMCLIRRIALHSLHSGSCSHRLMQCYHLQIAIITPGEELSMKIREFSQYSEKTLKTSALTALTSIILCFPPPCSRAAPPGCRDAAPSAPSVFWSPCPAGSEISPSFSLLWLLLQQHFRGPENRKISKQFLFNQRNRRK